MKHWQLWLIVLLINLVVSMGFNWVTGRIIDGQDLYTLLIGYSLGFWVCYLYRKELTKE